MNTAAGLRLWSNQTAAAWEVAQEVGVLKADGRRVYSEFRPAYRWLSQQMKMRTPDYNCSYPVWAWLQPKPDLRRQGHLAPGTLGVRIECVVPASSTLVSDFMTWENILGNTYVSLNEAEDRDFTCRSKEARDNPQLLHALEVEKQASWERVFNIDLLRNHQEWCGSADCLQATLGQISLEQIVSVKHFQAK